MAADKIKRSYAELNGYLTSAQQWINKSPENVFTKLGYAMARLDEQLVAVFREYNMQVQETSLKYCATDSKGRIMKDDKGDYIFEPKQLIECNKEHAKLFESLAMVTPCIAKEMPKERLTPVEEIRFVGLVLTQEMIDAAHKETEHGKSDSQTTAG